MSEVKLGLGHNSCTGKYQNHLLTDMRWRYVTELTAGYRYDCMVISRFIDCDAIVFMNSRFSRSTPGEWRHTAARWCYKSRGPCTGEKLKQRHWFLNCLTGIQRYAVHLIKIKRFSIISCHSTNSEPYIAQRAGYTCIETVNHQQSGVKVGSETKGYMRFLVITCNNARGKNIIQHKIFTLRHLTLRHRRSHEKAGCHSKHRGKHRPREVTISSASMCSLLCYIFWR